MDSNLVITIGRTFGSGGREIGKALAAELGMKYYDKEILAEAAKESEIDSLHAAVLTGGMNPHPHCAAAKKRSAIGLITAGQRECHSGE